MDYEPSWEEEREWWYDFHSEDRTWEETRAWMMEMQYKRRAEREEAVNDLMRYGYICHVVLANTGSWWEPFWCLKVTAAPNPFRKPGVPQVSPLHVSLGDVPWTVRAKLRRAFGGYEGVRVGLKFDWVSMTGYGRLDPVRCPVGSHRLVRQYSYRGRDPHISFGTQ